MLCIDMCTHASTCVCVHVRAYVSAMFVIISYIFSLEKMYDSMFVSARIYRLV